MANLLGRAIVYVLNKSGALEIIQARAFADVRKRMRLLEKRNENEFPDVQRRIRRLEQLLGDEPTQVASINFDHDRIEQHIQRKIGECQLELFPLPHIVVDDILPGEFYEALVGNIMQSPSKFWFSICRKMRPSELAVQVTHLDQNGLEKVVAGAAH